MQPAADHCRRADADAFFAAQFLPAAQRGAAYALSALARQLHDILTSASECEGGGCGSGCSSSSCETPPPASVNPAANTCTTFSPCGGQGGGACGGFGPAERLRVCDSVLDYLWKGEVTGKPELDAAAALVKQRQWPVAPWKQWCRGVLALHAPTRLATWRRLRELCEQEAGVLAQLAAAALVPDWQADAARLPQRLAWATALRLPRLIADLNTHWRQGRLLLPLDDLLAAGLSEQDIARFSDAGGTGGDPRWATLIEQQSQRMASLYRGGVGWLGDLPASHRRALAVYGELQLAWFETWRRQGADPFAPQQQPTLNTLRRLARVPRAIRVLVK
jgi:phytoene/squalene synthetase